MLLYIFKSVLLCSCVGTALIIMFRLLRPVTERFFSSSWHYFAGLLVMIVMITPLRISLPQRVVNTGIILTQIEEKNESIYSDFSEEAFVFHDESDERTLEALTAVSGYAWAGVAAALILGREIKYLAFMRKLRRETVPCDELTAAYIKKVRKSSFVSSPMVAGIFEPTLYLPDIPLTEEEKNVILSHETIHLKRKDLVAKRLIGFIKCIHFFNPFVYVLSRQIDLDCEISCDLAATKEMSGSQRKDYMTAVLSLASQSTAQRSSFSMNILSGRETLKRRFLKIYNREKISKKTKIISAVIAALMISSSLCVSGVLASSIEKPEAMNEETRKTSEHEFTHPAAENNSLHPTVTEQTEPTEEPIDNLSQTIQQPVPNAVSSESEKFAAPCDISTPACEFGYLEGPGKVKRFHCGIDFSLKPGSPVYASADGKVITTGWDKENAYENGIVAVIRTADGTELIYEHLESVSVKKGDTVKAGELIAKSGASGMVTGPILHFSVMKNGEYVDPALFLG